MTTWQKIAIGIGLFAVFVGLIFGIVSFATSGASETIDEFLAAASKGDYAAAHALTAEQMQASTLPKALERFIKGNGLDKVSETSWSSRSVSGDAASFEGTLTTRTGGKVPVTIGLVKENGAWRILGIDATGTGLQGSGGSDKVSDAMRQQAVALTRIHQAVMLRAVRTGDFEYLKSFMVPELRTEDLAAVLVRGSFTDADLIALEEAVPNVTSVEIRGGNLMWVEATSIAQGNGVNTRFTYREDPDRAGGWLIQAISFEGGALEQAAGS